MSIPYHQLRTAIFKTYRMLVSVCYLVLEGLLQTTSNGSVKLMKFVDEQRMCRLYEKFILEYYRKEHPELTANTLPMSWQLDDGFGDMLPIMQIDIMLSHEVAGMLLYAKTDEEIVPDQKYKMSGNQISMRTLDLNRSFESIRE